MIPDITTVLVILGSVISEAFIYWRIRETRGAISQQEFNFKTGNDPISFIMSRSRLDMYSALAFPLFFLLPYLGLFLLLGSPDWGSSLDSMNEWWFVPQICFFIALIVLLPFILAYDHSNEFFMVLPQKIVQKKGGRTTSIDWSEVTGLSTNLGREIERGDLLQILITGDEKRMIIDVKMKNVNKLIKIIREKVPDHYFPGLEVVELG